MGQWFAPADDALGGTADAVRGAGDFFLGGLGSTVGNVVGGAASTAGDAAGGLFGPLGNWLLKVLAVLVVGGLVVKVV